MQALFDDPPQQGATVVTEGGGLEAMAAELVGDVDTEALVR